VNAGAITEPFVEWRRRLEERFRKWVNRRIPPAREVTLDQKRIFIFPSRVGMFFFVCLLVMLMTAINFESNLSYGLTFWLATLFIIATLHTYANLSGVTLRAVRAQPAFPGQQSEFELILQRGRRRDHYALRLQWPSGSETLINLLDNDPVRVRLHVPVAERGWFSPGRLLLESTYPLGLLRCWTWVDLDIRAMVYPRPLSWPDLSGASSDAPDGAAELVKGDDDFFGFRNYQKGDSLRHVNWKALAKGQGMQTRQYTAYAERTVWLDWEMFQGLGVEQRLSYMCYWVLEFDADQEEYGLRLPGYTLEPGHGERHKEAALKALALYGLEGSQ